MRVVHKPMFTLRRLLTNVKDKDEPEDRPGAVYKIKCSDCQATYISRWDRQKLNHATKRKQTSNKNAWPKQQHRQTPLKNKPHYRLGFCYGFNPQYRLPSTNYTRTSCPKSKSTSSRTLQTFTRHEKVTHCLLFISQLIYLQNLSHASSQPIT